MTHPWRQERVKGRDEQDCLYENCHNVPTNDKKFPEQ